MEIYEDLSEGEKYKLGANSLSDKTSEEVKKIKGFKEMKHPKGKSSKIERPKLGNPT